MSDSPIARRLDAARRDLLELSTRNRLLSTPRRRKRSRSLEIVDEKSDEVFRLLVEKGKAMTFDPAPDKPEEPAPQDPPSTPAEPSVEQGSAGALFRQPDEAGDEQELPQTQGELPKDGPKKRSGEFPGELPPETSPETPPKNLPELPGELPGGEAIALKRYTDRKLQTILSSADLQKRLLRTFYDARTSQQEQGVNTLYLALGFLKWFEDDKSDKERYAPLLLIPVSLERKNARTRFLLRHDEGEIATNLSLQAKLRAEFNVELPDVPEDQEDFTPGRYFEQVRQAVKGAARWEVLGDDVVLSFFSFSKFLMYRDLDAENWASDQPLAEHPLLNQLLGDAGFPDEPPIIDDQTSLDEVISPQQMIHVVPADTSQSIAIEAVRQGRNLVVQGPPGTGKSQTIANLIAAAVKEGKRVLFVAEKMAALEVVKRRLTNVGLGEMCLELHSHKARKRAVLDDLKHTLALGGPKTKPTELYFQKLTEARDTLNRHAEALHAPIADSGVTPYQAIGQLVRLRAADVDPAEFTLDEPVSWTAGQAADARKQLGELLEQIAVLTADSGVDAPAQHPWRGAAVASILPMDLDRLIEKWPDATASLRSADEKTRALVDALEDDGQTTAALAGTLAGRARRLAEAPAVDREAIIHDVWTQQATAVTGLVEQGLALTAVRKQLDGKVSEAAWAADLTQARLDLAAYGTSWLRWMNGAYKRAKRQLAGVLLGPSPKALADRLALVDQVLEAQKSFKSIERDDAIGRYAFGSAWRSEASDWDTLGKLHGWNRRNEKHGDDKRCRELLAILDTESLAKLPALADDAERAVASAGRAFSAAVSPVKLDLQEAFGVDEIIDVPLGLAAKRISAWTNQPGGLTRWISYRDHRAAAKTAGLTQLVEGLDAGAATAAALDSFDMAYHEALLRRAYEDSSKLKVFNGKAHSSIVQKFGEMDRDRIEWARVEVALAHFERLPKGRSSVGQVGVLLQEFNRKRGHMAIRKLLDRAGQAVQSIKPVFMMSPMSIAQYLGPGGLSFDLMIVDEASQVRPVDAMGAIARCQQIVIVGDDKQLPPTSFFDTLSGGDGDSDDEDEDAVATADLESILSLCKARAMPDVMLRWHYRSKHPSLIAVSNREFYESRLFVIPSPDRFDKSMGLQFRHVKEGYYDRGGARTHQEEAKLVAEAVMQHAHEHPKDSLGVGTFSVAQRDAILDQIELLRREDASVETFFSESGEEPFFVKNLENIQGDERDVIFISVGYGKDENGKMWMSFGPLSNDGGERRLNVLITRSKRKCVVFSSITSNDIDVRRVNKRGPVAFKTFLHFAEHGAFREDRVTDRGFDSPFEEEVARALRQVGYEAEPQIGEAGFYIDLGVVDPDQPGRFLLGVECDGASYHSARSARERDRARQAILEMRGWTIHRIWSTDWFNQPKTEIKKLIEAIDAVRDPAVKEKERAVKKTVVIAREAAASDDKADRFAGIPVQPYAEAGFKKVSRKEIEDLDYHQRVELMTKIVEIEAPVHGQEGIRRAAEIYNEQRLTHKLSAFLESALGDAVNAGKLESGLGFYTLPGVSSVSVVRDRSDVESSGLRKPEFLPPAEIRFALESVARVAIGVSHDDAVPACWGLRRPAATCAK